MIEVYIEEEVAIVAARTNDALQAKRTAGELPASFPTEVFYMYGHITEIVNRLQKASEGKTTKVRYPLIVLLTDVPEKKKNGFQGDAKLQVLIVNHTDGNVYAPDRMEQNFKPILTPIKEEFLNQLSLYEGFTRPGELIYTAIRHYFWGSQLNKANPFNDKLDAIELRDIEVTVKEKVCEPVTGSNVLFM